MPMVGCAIAGQVKARNTITNKMFFLVNIPVKKLERKVNEDFI
jgi:hypothetical protein